MGNSVTTSGGEDLLLRALAEAQLLNTIAAAASSQEDLAGILSAALNELRRVIAFTGGSIAVVEGDDLVIRAAVGPFADAALGQRIRRGPGHSWSVVEKAEPFWSNDLHAEGARTTTPIRSYLAVPLLWRGSAIGILEVDSTEPRAFTEEDVDLMKRVAPFVSGPIQLARRAAAEQQARAEAEAAVRARDVFLGVAAHELKTPVTSMRGYAQLILRRLDRSGGVEPDRLRQAMVTIDQQAEKLGRLMIQLLDVTRMDAGRFIIEPEPVDVGSLIFGVVEMVKLHARGRRVQVNIQPCIPLVEADPLRLEQVLSNLLDNAVKFSREDGTIHIVVEAPDQETVQISVRDEGVGVPLQHRPRIFDRFFQAHGEGYQGGMGLGLYISRQIVARHGGTLVAEFPPDGGTRFVVKIPCHRQSPVESGEDTVAPGSATGGT
ncbi:MAG TPA: GAF domain-containing sensor histidine kinase [Chloroflexota bacterium]|nr:GAF domain-containing sensor histidine kinase [Chloroflexota bacterium]